MIRLREWVASLLELGDWPIRANRLLTTAYCLLFTVTALLTFRDYFITWANDPAVRVQYESTMMAAMRYLNEIGTGATAVSTITPHSFHSPALAQMTLHDPITNLRWFDARTSLLWPTAADSAIMIPGFTPVTPALQPYLADTAVLHQSLPLRPSDADRPLDIYQITTTDTLLTHFTATPAVVVGNQAAELLGYDLQTPAVRAGDMVQLATLWRVNRPLPDAILFTHLIGPDGNTLSSSRPLGCTRFMLGKTGDLLVQLHEFTVPETTAVGIYPLTIGFYTPHTGQRIPLSFNGSPLGDHVQLTTLTISGE